MSLHYLMKYLCSETHHAQEVIEANCHVRLSWQKDVHISHTKKSYDRLYTTAVTKKKMSLQNAVHDQQSYQSLMASVCQSQSQNWFTKVRSSPHSYGTHMPHRITQCYLPPGRGDIPAITPPEAGTRLSDPGEMQGWVDLVGWLHTETVYPSEDGHPSRY